MVLLMVGKDQCIQYLAAGNSRVIPHNGVNETGPVFKRTVIAEHKAHCLNAVEHAAAVSDNSVDQLNAFPDLRRFCCRRPDG